MRLAAPLVVLLLCGCGVFSKVSPPKETVIEAPGGIKVRHDGSSEKPPVVTDKTNTDKLEIPPRAKVTVIEEKGTATAMGPGNKPVDVPVDRKTVFVELPAEAGATLTNTRADVVVTGSTGHAPPPPPTPFEQSLSAWTYGGMALFAVGVFFCTPWGGGNYRVGGLIALGGVAMGVTGYLLNEVTQIGLPRWFPVVGLLGVAGAILLYYGYRLRAKQHLDGTEPVKKDS